MSHSDLQTGHVQINHDGLAIDAYMAQPAADGLYPPVIVVQEIFGVNAHIRDITERIAREGYIAIAPALYQRLAPGFEAGYTLDDIKLGRQYKDQTHADELLGDVQAAIDFLSQQPASKPGGVGCIGFCFGGHVAFLAATLPSVAATASFYGAGIPTWCPGGGDPSLSRTGDINGTLYAFFGMEDLSIPPEHVEQLEAALTAHHVPHQIFRYPEADHGFFCDRRASYHEAAAADAWVQVKALFQQVL